MIYQAMKNTQKKLKCMLLSERRQSKKSTFCMTTIYHILEQAKLCRQ